MALTTLQFWQQQLAIHLAAQGAAQSSLMTAQTAQKDSAAALTADLKAMDAGAAKIAAQRAQLAVTSIPAEAGALITQITQGVIAQRKLQGTVLDDKAKLADAGVWVDAANTLLTRCKSRVAAVQAAITAAGIDGKQRDMLKTAIAAPPLLTIANDASDLLASLNSKPIKDLLDRNFPSALQTIAQKRYATRTGRLTSLGTVLAAAQDAWATALADHNGRGGAVEKTSLGLQRAQAALADQVANVAARYAKAQALYQKLQAVNPPTVPDVLTDAEQASRKTLDDSGAAAVPAAEGLDTELKNVFTAWDAVDAAVLDQIANNVDQLPNSAGVAGKRADAGAAQLKFDTDVKNFPAAGGKDLDQWEAVIPDPAWSVLLDYEEPRTTTSPHSPTLRRRSARPMLLPTRSR
jgi:hypothetical protein